MSKTAEATPGPWVIYDDGRDGSDIILANVDGENYDIAYISDSAGECRPPEERKANAALIVRAVNLYPELVEALENFLALWPGVSDGSRPAHPDVRMAVNIARDVLEKARAK